MKSQSSSVAGPPPCLALPSADHFSDLQMAVVGSVNVHFTAAHSGPLLSA